MQAFFKICLDLIFFQRYPLQLEVFYDSMG